MSAYTDKALRNIIKENINNKRIVYLAAKIYAGIHIWDEAPSSTEDELTKHLLNKQYEKLKEELDGSIKG